ncbi:hypothetical protein BDP27DRAFT_1434405 [Rhodocollybia butyracea]|uniref:Uncharacterized protein n=1 Tax=Rhodocollybia butyracea TaxID=206335 RepID=A0A9P5TWV8_9AGAR|nr:hypothetical protein BDP27DRAFT_1434405 [Rhodocollybia butyracea]
MQTFNDLPTDSNRMLPFRCSASLADGIMEWFITGKMELRCSNTGHFQPTQYRYPKQTVLKHTTLPLSRTTSIKHSTIPIPNAHLQNTSLHYLLDLPPWSGSPDASNPLEIRVYTPHPESDNAATDTGTDTIPGPVLVIAPAPKLRPHPLITHHAPQAQSRRSR